VAAGARGLARGEVFTADGDLVVSVVQEGLIRVAESPSAITKSQVEK
ncbi:MAG: acyl-CoA thioesterase II, partial [Nocardiopsaceae bacterium]|nr:acyl-CoA thioesterase II [Nocardiopsaceae bacterium]